MSGLTRWALSGHTFCALVRLCACVPVCLCAGACSHFRTFAHSQFGLFLVGDVLRNCINTTKTGTAVDYFWASDGNTGVLFGMLKRPDSLEIRLVTYVKDKPASVT